MKWGSMQMLIVNTLEGDPRVFELYGEDVSIGRDRIHDMQLADASVIGFMRPLSGRAVATPSRTAEATTVSSSMRIGSRQDGA